ncbi:MAG: hypothetical protein ACLFU8_18095 [Anaerolineales bacterium]
MSQVTGTASSTPGAEGSRTGVWGTGRYRIHYFLDPERLAGYRELTRELLGQAFIVEEEAP